MSRNKKLKIKKATICYTCVYVKMPQNQFIEAFYEQFSFLNNINLRDVFIDI